MAPRYDEPPAPPGSTYGWETNSMNAATVCPLGSAVGSPLARVLLLEAPLLLLDELTEGVDPETEQDLL
jgi:ABC-type transport system involved in cytochrome bd biosynthesis fused ATPase/permease subunit